MPLHSKSALVYSIKSPLDMSSNEKSSSDEIDEHKMSIKDVCIRYGTIVDEEQPMKSPGLSASLIDHYRQLNGHNRISPSKRPNPILEYIKHFIYNVFNLLLIISGVLCFILYAIDTSSSTNLYLGGILIFVAMFNAALEFYQEYKTAALLQSFLTLIPANALVIRENQTLTIPAADLVLGDLVILKTGDKVPADLRLAGATDLKVDNSSLTGESEPQERHLTMGDSSPIEAANIAFNGTLVVSGEGQGIVIRTGDKTMLGQIAGLTMNEKKRSSQLSREIDFFVKKLALIAVITAIVFFIFGLARGYSLPLTFGFTIGVFVAFVPEGLPVTVTALLTIAAKRMAKLNVLVKDLHGVETLGAITMLATDKTGTLTQNKMSVVATWTNAKTYSLQYDTEHPFYAHDARFDTSIPNYTALLMICALCTKCRVDSSELSKSIEERKIFGDATEVGLFKFSMSALDVVSIADAHKKVCEIPFSSNTKWHLTIHEMVHKDGYYVIYLKGAPERVLKKCSRMAVGGQEVSMTDGLSHQFNLAYEGFAGQGQRVLAFAQLLLPGSEFPQDFTFLKENPCNFPLQGFTFLGLVSLMDPPKRGVRKAISALRFAGIQVVMVTGDHPLTAEAIAKKIGLIQGKTVTDIAHQTLRPVASIQDSEYEAVIVHGDNIDTMTDKDWDSVFSKKEIVFARTSPRHKLLIVSRGQAKGHIVGVSGDGVNDSPALKKADLGISMNITGSDVSKEAAAMILLDDHFPSVVNGVFQGRLLFSNLKKSIRYTLTHVMPEVLGFLTFILFGIPLPLSAFLILFIDLVSEMAPSFSFAWEVPDSDLMLVPPRKVLCTKQMNNATFETLANSTTFASSFSADKSLKKSNLFVAISCPQATMCSLNDLPMLTQKPKFKDWLSLYWDKAISMLKRNFIRNETGEVLVDNDLLIWSYLEAGLIITTGCFGAYLMVFYQNDVPFNLLWNTSNIYFKAGAPDIVLTSGSVANADEQMRILASSQSGYYAGIVIGQWFTLFMVKHRCDYPYGWDLFKNYRSIISILISIVVVGIVVYVPAFNYAISTAPVGIIPLLMPLATGIFMIVFEFVRKFLRFRGYFGGVPTRSQNLLDLVRTTTTAAL